MIILDKQKENKEASIQNEWELQGNCNKCRCRDYCSKYCKTHKLAIQAQLYNIVAKETGLGAILDQLHK